ncbi:MAG: hypothetical protein F4Z52_00450 [Gammaproteobacteria bacterium]|nr:hypothetical protein [Gammaproteobacteria bacterium]
MAVAPARFRARMTGQYGRKDPAGLVNGDDAKPLRGASNGPEVTVIWGFLCTTVFDRILPSLSSADLMGTKLMLYCEEPLDTTSNPASSDLTATPELDVAFSDAGREYRLGWKPGLVSGRPLSLEYRVEATRTESANDFGPGSGHGIRLNLDARF